MIGIFDSGIGGLTVAREIIKRFPRYDIIYFGDTARSPYGDKSPELITDYTREDINWLIDKGAKVIVVACHSSSIIARDIIAQEVSLPVFDMVNPTIKIALSSTVNGRIGVLGTRATVNSEVYDQAILKQARQSKPGFSEAELRMPAYSRKLSNRTGKKIPQVFSQAAPLLVPLVEEGWVGKPETNRILKSYLQPLKSQQIDTLILACTHYPLLKKSIVPRIGKNVRVVDPGRQVALELEFYLKHHPEQEAILGKSRKRAFYVSDISPHFQKTAERWLGQPVNLLKK